MNDRGLTPHLQYLSPIQIMLHTSGRPRHIYYTLLEDVDNITMPHICGRRTDNMPHPGGRHTDNMPHTGGTYTGNMPHTGGGCTDNMPNTGGRCTDNMPHTGGRHTGNMPHTGGRCTDNMLCTGRRQKICHTLVDNIQIIPLILYTQIEDICNCKTY